MVQKLADLEDLIATSRLPSVAYGVSRGSELLFTGGDLNLPYALASVTKPLTATAIMLLAKQGQIDLEQPVNAYLSAAKLEARVGSASNATVTRILDHSAGLSTFFRFYYADEGRNRRPFDEVLQRYGKLMSAPGERYHYSNLGYGVLDALVSQLSRMSYDQFMSEEVFAPLGMKHSFIGPPDDRPAALSFGPDGVPYPQYDFDHPGGSAGYASVLDLLKFGQFHLGLGPNLLSSSERQSMQKRSSIIDGTRGYWLGWGVNLDRFGTKVIQHTGSMGGVTTLLRLVPEHGLVFTALVNGQTDMLVRAADDVLASLVPSFAEGLKVERSTQLVEPKLFLPEELYGNWLGHVETYDGDRELIVELGPTPLAILEGRPSPILSCSYDGQRLTGAFDGDLRTEISDSGRYRLHLDLKVEQSQMKGALLALYFRPEGQGGAPGKRMGDALPYWTTLSKDGQ